MQSRLGVDAFLGFQNERGDDKGGRCYILYVA